MAFMTPVEWQQCSEAQRQALLQRPAIAASDAISATVREVLDEVKSNGDAALRAFSARFDKAQVAALRVTPAEIAAAGARLSDDLKQAMAVAVANIETFHNAQQLATVDVETQPGVRCQQISRPLYSWRLRPALLDRADAGDPGAHRRLRPRGALLAAAHRR